MTIDRKQMKRDAQLAMRDHKPSIYITALVFLAVMTVLDFLSTRLQYPGLSMMAIAEAYYDAAALEELIAAAALSRSFLSRLLGFAVTIMSAVLSVGFTGVCLCVSRRESAGIGDLLDAFGFFFKVIWLEIVVGVFVALWSLLLVVPGIVASYRYSMAIFVLIHNPDKTVMQCIRESKAMTKGFKWELFVLDLSFIGWNLLGAIPFVQIYTMPYMLVTKANYFNALTGYEANLPEYEDFGQNP